MRRQFILARKPLEYESQNSSISMLSCWIESRGRWRLVWPEVERLITNSPQVPSWCSKMLKESDKLYEDMTVWMMLKRTRWKTITHQVHTIARPKSIQTLARTCFTICRTWTPIACKISSFPPKRSNLSSQATNQLRCPPSTRDKIHQIIPQTSQTHPI